MDTVINKSEVDQLIERANKAQSIAEKYTQEDVRKIAASVGWELTTR